MHSYIDAEFLAPNGRCVVESVDESKTRGYVRRIQASSCSQDRPARKIPEWSEIIRQKMYLTAEALSADP